MDARQNRTHLAGDETSGEGAERAPLPGTYRFAGGGGGPLPGGSLYDTEAKAEPLRLIPSDYGAKCGDRMHHDG